MEEEKTIYTLKLHEYMCVNNNMKITRVPRGWIYQDLSSAVFVPFDNEYWK